jgi:hypothetical protein
MRVTTTTTDYVLLLVGLRVYLFGLISFVCLGGWWGVFVHHHHHHHQSIKALGGIDGRVNDRALRQLCAGGCPEDDEAAGLRGVMWR